MFFMSLVSTPSGINDEKKRAEYGSLWYSIFHKFNLRAFGCSGNVLLSVFK